MESAASEQENEANELREKVISLWERLDIPVEFREDFLSNHHGYKTWVVEEVSLLFYLLITSLYCLSI